MIDVATPEGGRVLRSLAEAAGVIAVDGRERARPALQHALNRAYDELQQACVEAGSLAWS